MKHFYSLLIFSGLYLGTKAATFNSTGAGTDWSTSAAWTVVSGTDANGIPDSDDDIVILSGHSITLSATSYAKTITINAGGSFNPNSQSITLGGNFTNNGTVSNKLYITFPGVTATIQSSNLLNFSTLTAINSAVLNINATTSLSVTNFNVRNSSTVNNNGNVSISTLNTLASGGNTWNNLSGSTLNLDRNVPYTIGFNSSTNSKVAFFTSVTAIPNWTYYNFSLSGATSTKTVSANLVVNGTATVKPGNTLNMGNNSLTLGGDLDNTGTISNLNTLSLNGSSNQTLVSSSAIGLTSINSTNTNTIIVSSGTYNVSGSASFAKNLTINSGSTLNLNNTTLSLGGDLSNAGTLSNLSTVTLNGSANQTLTTTPALTISTLNATNSNTIILNSGTYNITNTATFAKNLTTNAAATLNLNNHTLTLGGDLSNTGTLSNLATVTLNGTSNQTLTTSAALTIPILNATNTNTIVLNSGTYNISTSATFAKSLTTNAAAILNLNNVTLTLGGDLTNSGTLSNLSTLSLNGSSNQTLTTTAALNIPIISSTNATSIILSSGTFNNTTSATFTGGLTLNAAGVLNMNSNPLTVGGNLSNSGTLSNLNLVTLNGSSSQNISTTSTLAIADLVSNNTAGTNFTSGTFTISNSLTVSSGNMNAGSSIVTLLSDATKTAYIAQSAGTMSGTMIIQRYLPGRTASYTDLSPSVSNTTIDDWDNELYMSIGAANNVPGYPGGDGNSLGFKSVSVYNEATNATTYVLTGASLTRGKGYTVWIADNTSSFPGRALDHRGTPNMGTVSITATNTASNTSYRGQNLIGNPHAAFIDWAQVVAASANVDPGVYIFNGSGNYVAQTNPVIAPGQGFYCYVTSTTTVNFPQAAKTTSTSSTFMRNAKDYDLMLTLSNSSNPYYHEIKLLSEERGAGQNDLPFLKSPLKDAPSFTINDNGKQLIKKIMKGDAETIIYPLTINSTLAGTYEINIDGLENNGEYAAYIINNITGEKTSLNGGHSFSAYFENEQTSNDYSLVITRKISDNNNNNISLTGNNNSISAFATAGQLHMNLAGDNSEPAMVEVYNLMGQHILSKEVTLTPGTSSIMSTEELTPDIYLIKISTTTGKVLNKKVILFR